MMEQIHEGVCSAHIIGHILDKKIIKQGYYYTTMDRGCFEYVKKWHKCQIPSNKMNVPPSLLYKMTTPLPFLIWGIYVIGEITPKASNKHQYILVAIDYFMKWVEAESYATLKANDVAKFLRNNIICRYGVPHELLSYHRSHFQGEVIDLLKEYKITHHMSVPYKL